MPAAAALLAAGALHNLYSQAPEIAWQEIGKIKPRHARNIPSSNLWIGGETLDRDYANYEQYKAWLGPLGAKKLRLQSGWAKTERAKGVYDFAWLDAIVNDALSQGVQPWIQISYGNLLYNGAGSVDLGGGIPHGEEGLAAWENYVRALVPHFKGRVREWEVWNESDLGDNIKRPDVYAELFYRTGLIIREIDPQATIVALSMARMDVNYVTAFMDYLQGRGAVSLIDVVTFHGYPTIPEGNFDKVEIIQNLIWKHNRKIRFWQGETGCPSTEGSSGALGGHPWTELTQAKWNLRRALSHLGRGIPFSLFLLCEFSYTKHPAYVNRNPLNTKGLLEINEKTLAVERGKPAYYAYQNLCAMFDGNAVPQKEFEHSARTSGHGEKLVVHAFRHKTNDRHAVVVWFGGEIPSNANHCRIATLHFPKLNITHPAYIDIRTGSIYRIPDSSIKRRGMETTISVPVYDSPCVITDEAFFETLRF
ncbi:hypothetical protein OH491_18155 [Termitidicoccus mucosus]|uniref:Glycosyl hydrolases family 39 N-terminal catalytic domain-containing protein n=1 Tax=Termitidicoccus mucosus TaxID=1184151 RepID=A0A178IKC5_9BACT|nr:hypothetical protein AW736_10455 [Opitutaceae bacterium TSB47]